MRIPEMPPVHTLQTTEVLSESTINAQKKSELLQMSPAELMDTIASFTEPDKLAAFLRVALADYDLLALLSYWQKWLTKDASQMMDIIVAESRENQDERVLPLGLEKRYEEAKLKLILSNVAVIQLTFGCSYGCKFCGVDAIANIREHIPYPQLEHLFKTYGGELQKGIPALYWASEPSDYTSTDRDTKKSYQDVHNLALEHAHYTPRITSINTTDSEWIRSMFSHEQNTPNAAPRRLSVFNKTQPKITQIRKDIHNSVDFVGAGSRHAVGIGLSRHTHPEEKRTGQATQKKSSGIAQTDGVLLTPRGIYNMVTVPLSDRHPQGSIIIPIGEIDDKDILIGDKMDVVMRHCVVKEMHSHGKMNRALNTEEAVVRTFVVHKETKRFVISIDTKDTVVQSTDITNTATSIEFGNSEGQAIENIMHTLDHIVYTLILEFDKWIQKTHTAMSDSNATDQEVDTYIFKTNLKILFQVRDNDLITLYTSHKDTTPQEYALRIIGVMTSLRDIFYQTYPIIHQPKINPVLEYIEHALVYLHTIRAKKTG